MNRETRLNLIKLRFQHKQEELDGGFGDMPITKEEEKETVGEFDSFQEFTRTNKSHLTSDE